MMTLEQSVKKEQEDFILYKSAMDALDRASKEESDAKKAGAGRPYDKAAISTWIEKAKHTAEMRVVQLVAYRRWADSAKRVTRIKHDDR
jgi:hypothetical protein